VKLKNGVGDGVGQWEGDVELMICEYN